MDTFDDVDTTGNPYEPGEPYHGHTAELRAWPDEALHELWESRINDRRTHGKNFMIAVGREITRRDNTSRWKDYATERGLTGPDADRFAAFVDSWDGEELADALTAYRDQA